MAFDFTTTFKPWSLNATGGLNEDELRTAFKNVFTQGHESEKDLLLKVFFFPDFLGGDVERAQAVLDVLTLLRANQGASEFKMDSGTAVTK